MTTHFQLLSPSCWKRKRLITEWGPQVNTQPENRNKWDEKRLDYAMRPNMRRGFAMRTEMRCGRIFDVDNAINATRNAQYPMRYAWTSAKRSRVSQNKSNLKPNKKWMQMSRNSSYHLYFSCTSPSPLTHYPVAFKCGSKAGYVRWWIPQPRDNYSCNSNSGLRPSLNKKEVILHDGW